MVAKPTPDDFKQLGIDPQAFYCGTYEEARKTLDKNYRKAQGKAHPDAGGTLEQSKKVSIAYDNIKKMA